MKIASLSLIAVMGAIPLLASAGQGIPIAPALRFESAVGNEFVYTDNMYRHVDNEVEGVGYKLVPQLGLYYAPGESLYSLAYKGELAEFDTASEDDYMDHAIRAAASVRPLTWHAFDVSANFQKEHDDLGTGRTNALFRTDNRELDQWESWGANGRYTFGAPSSRLKWFLSGLLYDKQYTTNRSDIPGLLGTRFLDRQDLGVGTGLSYELTPKSLLLATLDHTQVDYDTDLDPSLDGTLTQALVGYRWLSSAKTSGEAWFGRYERDFDDSRRGSGEGTSWLLKFSWAPKTYSVFSVEGGQSVEEAILQGENFVNREHLRVRWSHKWSSRTATFIGYRVIRDSFEGTNREDDSNTFTAGASYELSRFYAVKLEYYIEDRDSDSTFRNYKRDTVILKLDAQF